MSDSNIVASGWLYWMKINGTTLVVPCFEFRQRFVPSIPIFQPLQFRVRCCSSFVCLLRSNRIDYQILSRRRGPARFAFHRRNNSLQTVYRDSWTPWSRDDADSVLDRTIFRAATRSSVERQPLGPVVDDLNRHHSRERGSRSWNKNLPRDPSAHPFLLPFPV